MLEAEKSRPIRKWWRLVGAIINHVRFSILLDLRLKSAFFTTLGALSLLRRAWSMAGSTIKFTLELSSVDDWLFTEEAEEEKEEADDDDFCISIVVFELITFS